LESRRTPRFIALFDQLPPEVQKQAREAHQLWKADPSHPGLSFKKLHTRKPIYSVRIGLGWRALGAPEGDAIVWFWIGPHAEYDRLIKRL
jgi:hypothetical protein